MKVLLVDDEPDFLQHAKDYLEREEERLDIQTITSAEEALKMLDNAEDYEAIVSDYQMSGLNGLELLETVRKEKDSDIPFIIFTGRGREEVAINALNLGANRYLKKGGDPKSQYGVLSRSIVQEVEHWRSKEKLEKSEREKSIILDNTNEIVAYHDKDHNIIWANKAYAEDMGESLEELKGRKCYEIRLDREELCTDCPVDRAMKSGDSEEGKISRGGRQFLVRGSPVQNDNGEVIGAIETTSDISKEEEAEKKLKASEIKFRKSFEASPDPTFLLDEEGTFIDVNKSALQRLGFEKDEVVGTNIRSAPFNPQETVERFIEKFEKRKNEKEVLPYTVELRTKNGDKVPVEMNVGKFTKNGSFEGEIVIARDITNRKEKEEELRESEKRYRELFHGSKLLVATTDPEGRLKRVNRKAIEQWGYSEEELIGESILKIAHPDDRDKYIDFWGEILEKSGEVSKTIRAVTKDGETRWLKASGRPITENGEIAEVQYTAQDITEQRKKEKELRKSEKRYRELFESVNTSILVFDSSGKITSANPKIEDVLGVDGEGLKKKDPDFWEGRLYNKEGEPMEISEFPPIKAIDSKNTIDDFVLGVSMPEREEIIWLLTSATPQLNEEGEVERIIVSGTEITELQKTKEWIEKSRKRYEELFKGANELLVTTDTEGYVKRLNRKTEEVIGFPEEVAKGLSILWIAHPDDRDEHIDFWKRIMDGEDVTKTLRIVDRRGKVHWIKAGGRPIKENGEIVEIQYNAQDITERKRMEERQEFLHSLLRHDVRNKITITRGYLDLLKDQDLNDEQMELVGKALESTEKEARIIQKIRKIRKIEQEEEIEEVPLRSKVRDAIEENHALIKENEFQIESEIPEVDVQGGELIVELFSNLIGNSARHSNGSRIKISGQELNDEIQVTVEDDGKGISDEDKENIFDRGYKRGNTAGSGLGLSLVESIVESYGGIIDVGDSELGGAKFEIRLKKA